MATQAEMRAWLRANGYPVGKRGRIRGSLVAAYQAAHSEGAHDE